jgi:hypothetical protein
VIEHLNARLRYPLSLEQQVVGSGLEVTGRSKDGPYIGTGHPEPDAVIVVPRHPALSRPRHEHPHREQGEVRQNRESCPSLLGPYHLRLSKHEVHRPAAAAMGKGRAQVGEELGVGAAGVLQGVGK